MITSKDIRALNNGVFEFDYTTKEGKQKTVRFSKETFCFINCDEDNMLICSNKEQGIESQYIYDMEDRCDYLCLGAILSRMPQFGLNETIFKMQAERYDPTPDNEFRTFYGQTWYINPYNIVYMYVGDVIVNDNNEFKPSKFAHIKFKGMFGDVLAKTIDGEELKYILQNLHNN